MRAAGNAPASASNVAGDSGADELTTHLTEETLHGRLLKASINAIAEEGTRLRFVTRCLSMSSQQRKASKRGTRSQSGPPTVSWTTVWAAAVPMLTVVRHLARSLEGS